MIEGKEMIKLSELILDAYEDMQKEALSKNLLNRAYHKSNIKVNNLMKDNIKNFSGENFAKMNDASAQSMNFATKRMIYPVRSSKLFGFAGPKTRHSIIPDITAKNRSTDQ